VPPREPSRFVVDLWAGVVLGLPGTAWDFHRSVLTPLGTGEIALHLGGPSAIAVTLAEGNRFLGEAEQCFSRLGAWHTNRCRTATPPVLTLPGPFVTVRYRPALAA